MSPETKQQLKETLESQLGLKAEDGLDMLCVQVAPEKLLDLCKFLCRDERFEFKHCSGVTAYDDLPKSPRFTAVYHIYSYKNHDWLRLKVAVPESWIIPSVVSIWPGINWHERETFDMFGIRFEGHPNLKRILMPEGYAHHPLRKDFPLEGIEPDKLYREWERGRKQ